MPLMSADAKWALNLPSMKHTSDTEPLRTIRSKHSCKELLPHIEP